MPEKNAAGSSQMLLLDPGEQALVRTISGLPEAVLITRADLEVPGPTIIAVSAALCALTGYPAEELLGQNPRRLQGPLTDRQVLRRLREACAAGRHFVGEAVNYRKDGSTYILQWTVDPVRNSEGRVTHFFSLQQDVTAQRSFAREWLDAEDRAREAHEALAENMRAIAESILILESAKRDVLSRPTSGIDPGKDRGEPKR